MSGHLEIINACTVLSFETFLVIKLMMVQDYVISVIMSLFLVYCAWKPPGKPLVQGSEYCILADCLRMSETVSDLLSLSPSSDRKLLFTQNDPEGSVAFILVFIMTYYTHFSWLVN